MPKRRSLFNFAPKPKVLRALSNGARNLKVVTITYVKQNGETSLRDTEPYEIRDGKYWGYCLEKESIRQFNLERIIDATVTNTTFTPRWPVQII